MHSQSMSQPNLAQQKQLYGPHDFYNGPNDIEEVTCIPPEKLLWCHFLRNFKDNGTAGPIGPKK